MRLPGAFGSGIAIWIGLELVDVPFVCAGVWSSAAIFVILCSGGCFVLFGVYLYLDDTEPADGWCGVYGFALFALQDSMN